MKKIILTILVYLSMAVTLGAGSVDYGRSLKIKSLEVKVENLAKRIEDLRRTTFTEDDPLIEEQLKSKRDSLIMAARSEIVETNIQIDELKK